MCLLPFAIRCVVVRVLNRPLLRIAVASWRRTVGLMFTNGSVLQVYDVSKFVDRHPGGRDQLLMGAGRDVTQVFESYHKESTEKSVPCAMPYHPDGLNRAEHGPHALLITCTQGDGTILRRRACEQRTSNIS